MAMNEAARVALAKFPEPSRLDITTIANEYARQRMPVYDPEEDPVVSPYDIYRAANDLRLTTSRFPFAGGSIKHRLSKKYRDTYIELDFLQALDDYIDKFIDSVRQMPPDQIVGILGQLRL